jgi:LysR family transcriptional regulator, glycine cleavage system transcriptional activator
MNRHLPPFSSIRAFEAAARHLSFKEAAEELHVSDSAISHQIRNLEDFLHTPLFLRKPHGVTLTRRGEDYLSQLTAVLDMLDACTEQARGSGLAGPLKIQTTPAFAARWLVPRIRAFNQHYPDIELHITTSLAPPDFSRGDADVVVQYGVKPAKGLTVEPILYSARSPVASPDLLRQGMPLREPADLRHYTLLRDMVGDDWPAWFELASASPVELPGGPRFEHCNLTLGAAEQGQGVALAFLALAQSALAAGTLVRVFEAQTLPKAIYSVVFPTEWKSYGKVAAFRAWLMDQVEVWVAAMPGLDTAQTHQPACRHDTPTVSPVDLAAHEKIHAIHRHRPDRL